MKVAKIAAAPTLRMIGMRLPNSAQVKPPIDKRTIAIKISDGTVPVAAKPPITPMRMTKTGSGMMPILKSTIDHQPFGQKPSAPLGSACATLPISCATGCPPRFYPHAATVMHVHGERYRTVFTSPGGGRTPHAARRWGKCKGNGCGRYAAGRAWRPQGGTACDREREKFTAPPRAAAIAPAVFYSDPCRYCIRR